MPGLHLYNSNRLEQLADALYQAVSTPLSSPLLSELIIVQSRGMARWLTRELAGRAGIWANPAFPFPNRFVEEVLAKNFPDAAPVSFGDLSRTVWRLAKLLVQSHQLPGFEPLRHYLGDEADDLKLLQLAETIAETFDHYSVYRHEMVSGWEKGEESHWQARLWRQWTAGEGNSRRTALFQSFFDKAQKGSLNPSLLPERLSVFGISSLPPLYLDFFAALGHSIPVHLFFLNPSREYWGHIVSEKTKAKIALSAGAREELDQYFETGNPLLASWGRSGKDFFNLLIDRDPAEDRDCFVSSREDTLLGMIQGDILELRDRTSEPEKTPISPTDGSIQAHSCHSPLREIEVLYDQVLAWLDALPGLTLNDILVMTPDLEEYAPMIEAVFGGSAGEKPRLPYTIADRNLPLESPAIRTFLEILRLEGSRLTVPEVLDLLESPAVSSRFSLEPGDLELITRWIDETRIRWGIDGRDRRESGSLEFEENSWQAGLERLLLGYALPGDGRHLFGGILPCDGVEGSQSQVLGRLLSFLQEFFRQVRSLSQPRTLDEWSSTLEQILERLLAVEESEESGVQPLRSQIQQLARLQTESGFDRKVSLPALRHFLERQLGSQLQHRTFLSGGITFCAMLPMRSIPARVIALVGMNHDTFPRRNRPPGFDLMAGASRPGDRSLRDEDRYIFLEALLSARDRFYLSHCGQNQRDNHEAPPSVCLSELLDYIDRGFSPPPGCPTTIGHLLFRHRLQAFSPEYFSPGSRLFSYSRENREALAARLESAGEPQPFFAGALEEPPEEMRIVGLEELLRFFASPAQSFLRNRLGIRIEKMAGPLESAEPFELDSLDQYLLKEELIESGLLELPPEERHAVLKSRGVLPTGTPGRLWLEELSLASEVLKEKLVQRRTGDELPPLPVDLPLGLFRVRGALSGIWPEGQIRWRAAEAKPKDLLNLWIRHLVLNSAPRAGYPLSSFLLTSDEDFHLPALKESETRLAQLLQLYWEGLRRPLPFFPKCSHAYAKAIQKGKQEEALEAARRAWEPSPWQEHGPESRNPYNQLAFRDTDPFGEEFQRLAVEVFVPLLEALG